MKINKISMSLSAALTYKKRVLGWLNSATADITANNSRKEGQFEEVNVRKRLEDRRVLVSHMLDLKTKMNAATMPIFQLILEIGELKSELSMYNSLRTTQGVVPAGYREEKDSVYIAVVGRKERDQKVEELQNKLDQIQSQIDAFNNKTTIQVDKIESIAG